MMASMSVILGRESPGRLRRQFHGFEIAHTAEPTSGSVEPDGFDDGFTNSIGFRPHPVRLL